MELKPHPHAEVIKAFADGKPIQVFCNIDKAWRDWEERDCPKFHVNGQYRIKPATKKYRVALMRYGNHTPQTYSVQSSAKEKDWEGSPYFVRWLTPWIEYEV